ncbi:RadC family protein [Acetivibrio clariflavus]|uniref:DNA repair protein radc n=2 Tax=Acetivibrio clariflavus TaxID=288965 RepID=G8LU28_ACECE|nr:DNA repair protein RadC [Acetivibrio clariflavus]AEV68416.1 DNA repair protein radc [Acetivibrio clariflavus DSM 19732]
MHEGHRKRLKMRFLKEGLDSFEPHQVLELLLFYSIPRKDTNELAHKLLERYGSLSGVFDADIKDIVKIPGIGENTAFLLNLIPHLARRYHNDKWGPKPELNSSSKAGNYAISLFAGRNYEAFFIICLDAQNRVNYSELVHEGTINEAPVYPRLLVEAAIRHKANSVILAHNHPGGTLNPSRADMEATKTICTALESISIKVIDHIIVCGDKYYSFAENGKLEQLKLQNKNA